jgi:hypothetical protein
MTVRRAFFPNLDANAEFEARLSYQPRKETLVALARQTPLLGQLVLGDLLLDRSAPPRFDRALADVAVCWCPTQHAHDVLERAGWPVPHAPAHEVLRRVNSRRFLVDHGPNVIGRTWVERGSDLAFLGSQRFRLKRAFGFAGRGQRVVDEVLSPDDWRWVEDSLDRGFSAEPEFELAQEFSLHGYVDQRGLLLGTPCRFLCNRFGSAVHFELAKGAAGHEQPIRDTAMQVATALTAAGYFGPFGIDAFIARTARGEFLNPLSDLNARFTLAWSIGMGPLRETALRRLTESSAD